MAEVRETVELSFAEGMLSDIAGDVFEDSPEQVVPGGSAARVPRPDRAVVRVRAVQRHR